MIDVHFRSTIAVFLTIAVYLLNIAVFFSVFYDRNVIQNFTAPMTFILPTLLFLIKTIPKMCIDTCDNTGKVKTPRN